MTTENALLPYAESDNASSDLAKYLGTYSGRLFDKWATPEHPAFTLGDVVAVKALSVEVPPEAVDQLLTDESGSFGAALAALGKHSIEDDTALWFDRANELHARLKELDGVASVIAGKLMHAKLPRLIPIWDVRTADGLPYASGEYWLGWKRDYDDEVRDAVAELKKRVPAAAGLTDLRILDIVIWMAKDPGAADK